jgi:hypothetical protein
MVGASRTGTSPGGQKEKWFTDVWADPNLKFFFYFIISQILKSKTEAFLVPKNIQTLHDARFGLDEQISPLVQLQIPNASHVINFGANSIFNLL